MSGGGRGGGTGQKDPDIYVCVHCKNYSREFRARGGVPQDHNLPAAEICRIIDQEHSLKLSARDRKFLAVSGTFLPKLEISA
jgi:hypothetical protein